jgi:A-factor biosynthesis hotdog protein
MIPIAELVDHLHPWTEPAARSHGPLDRILVHKHREENVFVSRIEQIARGEEEDNFMVQFYLDRDHPFFFEHPLDHYPGLMLLEAARQAATALTHLFYGVPLDSIYIMQGLAVDFTAFAELDEPVFGLNKVSDKKFRQGQLTGMFSEGVFIQRSKPIGTMSGRWQIYDRRAALRLRAVSKAAGS